jgi:hypothetical protein
MVQRIDIKGVAGPMRVLFVPAGEVSPNFQNVEPKKSATIEFYDGRYSHTPDGQFISSYYVFTLMEHKDKQPIGLDLMGDVPNWKIDGRTFALVSDWMTYHNES